MNSINVSLIVIPAGIDQQRCAGCDPAVIGSTFSTEDSFDVVKVPSGYVILYRDDIIQDMDPDMLGANIIKTLINGLPENVGVKMQILYNFHDASDPSRIAFDEDAGMTLLNLSTYFYENRSEKFNYVSSESIMEVSTLIKQAAEDDDEEDEDDENDFPDGFIPGYTGTEDDGDDGPIDTGSAFEMMQSLIRDEKKKKGKKSKSHYNESRLVSNGKCPKRDYGRHGVVICRDKKDFERDEKIIKAFLKDFIPGSARWKRDFREDLLERWMKALTIPKKRLRKLEKKMKRKKKSKKPSPGQLMAMDFTRRMVSAANDPWNNPNK